LDDARARQKALSLRTQTVQSRIKVKRQIQRDALDDAFLRFERFERRMDTLESQLEAMDIGRDVSPDLAAQIDVLTGDERISDDLARLKKEMSESGEGAK
jgi:phage shock protein A